MKNISKERMTLYILFTLILVFAIWFVGQKAIWNYRFSDSQYLNQLDKQAGYQVKRVSEKIEGFGVPFVGMVEDGSDPTSVYLDPSGQSVWLNFEGTYSDHPDSTNLTYPSYWENYSFEGEIITSLTSSQIPPKGGVFLKNELSGVDFDIHDPKNTLHAISFKHESFNWEMLNPASYYGISSSVMGTKGFWEGHVQMRLDMPNGPVDFKILTGTATLGYMFKCTYYELPESVANGEVVIVNLKSTWFGEDTGWYFIYKNDRL